MKVVGIEGMTRETLARELDRGARFVVFQYVISVVFRTFKRPTAAYYIAPGENSVVAGLRWTILTLLLGWWGIPWGFIWTPAALYRNLRGGIDVTEDIAQALLNPAAAAADVEA